MLIILLPLLFDTEKNVCINFQRLPVQPLLYTADERKSSRRILLSFNFSFSFGAGCL
jgi:hypothetical protein